MQYDADHVVDPQDQQNQINLKEPRDKFYLKLKTFIEDEMRSDHQYWEQLQRGDVDIDVKCLTRDQLPEKVRPK